MRAYGLLALVVLLSGLVASPAFAMGGGGGMPGGGGSHGAGGSHGGGGSGGGGGGGMAGGGSQGGGGSGGGSAHGAHQGSGRSGGGMIGARSSQGGGGRAAKDDKQEFNKAALPPAVEIAGLDATKFDGAAGVLALNTEQTEKVTAAKTELKVEGEKLSKAQSEARAAYEKASCEGSCAVAARQVLDAAAQCRSFNGNQRFNQLLAKILTGDQWSKYRELFAKN